MSVPSVTTPAVRRVLSFGFSERMAGTLTQDHRTLAFSFAIRAQAQTLWQFLTDGMMDVHGELTLGEATVACSGRLRMPVRQLRVDLTLDFHHDGVVHQYVAMKRVTLWRFLRNITVFHGFVQSPRGRLGQATTYFNLRRDVFALLSSISFWR